MNVTIAQSASDISKCWKAMHALRPHLNEDSFVADIQRLQQDGYTLIFIEEAGEAVSVGGFVTGKKLARGEFLYVDDLSTLPPHQGKGYGSFLLDWMIAFAREKKIDQVHLDSGVQRFTAHRFYLHKGFNISSHHFMLKLYP